MNWSRNKVLMSLLLKIARPIAAAILDSGVELISTEFVGVIAGDKFPGVVDGGVQRRRWLDDDDRCSFSNFCLCVPSKCLTNSY